jgi:nitrite reductase/ring-hydroxylating ferredoxin subunit
MTRFHRAARVKDVPPGTGTVVTVNGAKLALFNVGGAFHALSNTCPHQGGPLGEGFLQGPVVTCPLHFWRFDVRTGQAPEFPEAAVDRYPVKVEGEDVLVGEAPLPAAPAEGR